MKQIISMILVAGSLLTAPSTFAAECTKEEAIQAETNASTLKNWEEVHAAFKKFAHCDDGAIAEGYSESVSQLLASHWDQLGRLEKILKSDHNFEAFVIKHIDQTITKENAAKIVDNARSHCPKKSKALCKKIESAAK